MSSSATTRVARTAATADQLVQLRRRAVNEVTIEIQASGISLTHEQADELGVDVLDWMSKELGLEIRETDSAVECAPAIKRGRGRPSLGGQARDKLVTVRLTATEHAAIESAVESSGDAEATPASWLRDRAREAVGES